MTNEAETPPELLTAETDWFLQSFVHVANDSSLEIGITLQVSGMLVSGNLISHKQYFDDFAAEFSSAISDKNDAESVRTKISSYGDLNKPDEESQIQPPPQYIHLKDARFFNTAGKPIPSNRSVLWRGRICEVSGFFFGRLGVDQPTSSNRDA